MSHPTLNCHLKYIFTVLLILFSQNSIMNSTDDSWLPSPSHHQFVVDNCAFIIYNLNYLLTEYKLSHTLQDFKLCLNNITSLHLIWFITGALLWTFLRFILTKHVFIVSVIKVFEWHFVSTHFDALLFLALGSALLVLFWPQENRTNSMLWKRLEVILLSTMLESKFLHFKPKQL